MKTKLSLRKKSWLLGLHIIFTSAWLGAAFVLLLLILLPNFPNNQIVLTAIPIIIRDIDLFVIIPAGIGVLLTGYMLCIFTHWGVLKYGWVITKQIGTVFLVIFGAIWLSPLVIGAVKLTSSKGLLALQDPNYLIIQGKLAFSSIIVLPLMLALVFISFLKPWLKRNKVTPS